MGDEKQQIQRKEAAEYQDAALMGISIDDFENKFLLPNLRPMITASKRKQSNQAQKFITPLEYSGAQRQPKLKNKAESTKDVSRDENDVLTSLVSLSQVGSTASPDSTLKLGVRERIVEV